jgi:hypothetical protein
MARETDTRHITLVDLPLIRRLGSKATVLDNTIEFTQDVYEPNTSTLTNILLPQRSLVTLVSRSAKSQVVGQVRLPPDDQNAQIVYIAPHLDEHTDNTPWLHLLDAMAREVGQRNGHALVAEVAEDASLFETMRNAGFAVYARQRVWRRTNGHFDLPENHDLIPRAVTDVDVPQVHALIASIVPTLMQPFYQPQGEFEGLLYRHDGRVAAFIEVTTGKQGIYLSPYVREDHADDVPMMMVNALRQLPRAEKLPIYVRVSRYQEWLNLPLEKLGFAPGLRQAMMVRHITAGVRHAQFKPVHVENAAVAGPAKYPPNNTRNTETTHVFDR